MPRHGKTSNMKDVEMGIKLLSSKIAKETSANKTLAGDLGLLLDNNGYELLPLMNAHQGATFKGWYEGTRSCPYGGYITIFPDKRGKLEKKWIRTKEVIDLLRREHINSNQRLRFATMLLNVKRNCMYWQGAKKTDAAKKRAVENKIAAKFKKVKSNRYQKAETIDSRTASSVPSTHTITTVKMQIKSAVTSLEIMLADSEKKKNSQARLKVERYGNLLDLLRIVQSNF